MSALTPARALAQSAAGQFLLISDIHFNPFYDGSLFDRLRDRPVEDWAGILEASKPAGINPRGTDSNYALVKSSLDEARARMPRPDFILYPGDFMAHQWQQKYDGLAKASHMEDPAGLPGLHREGHPFPCRGVRSPVPRHRRVADAGQ